MKFCPTGTLGQSLYFSESHVFMSKCPHLETGNLDICFKSIVIRMKRDVVWEGLYIVRDQPAPIFSPPSILHFSPTSVSAPLEGRHGAPSPLWMHRAHQPCPANRGPIPQGPNHCFSSRQQEQGDKPALGQDPGLYDAIPSPHPPCSLRSPPSPWALLPLPVSSLLPCVLRLFSLFSPAAFPCCACTLPAFTLHPCRLPRVWLVLQVSQPHSPPSPQGSPVYEDGDGQDAEQREAAYQRQHLQGGKVGCGRVRVAARKSSVRQREEGLLTVSQCTWMTDEGRKTQESLQKTLSVGGGEQCLRMEAWMARGRHLGCRQGPHCQSRTWGRQEAGILGASAVCALPQPPAPGKSHCSSGRPMGGGGGRGQAW